MKKVIAFVSVVVFLSVSIQSSYAEERTTIFNELLKPKKTVSKVKTETERFQMGVGAWPTTGRLDSFVYQPVGSQWTTAGGVLLASPGDTISKLQNKLNSTMVIMDVDMFLFYFFYLDASMGIGSFGGQHRDYDWEPRFRPDFSSLSYSSADGYSMVWDANAELRCIDWNAGKSFIDLSLGYLYYRDNIEHLHDSTTTIWNYNPVNDSMTGHDSQDKYTFDGFRIGSRVRVEIFDRIAFKGRAGVLPWMNAVNKGYWNLRQTQFLGTARGAAYDLMGGFEFRITKNFLVEAGYKYMYFSSDKGTQRVRSPGEESYNEGSFSANASRGGFYFMGRITM
jgi:hypothetical protein